MKAIMSMRVAEVAAYGEKRNCIAYEYVETMEARGFHVVLVPNNTVSVERYMQGDDIALVVLTGGNTVIPKGGNREVRDVYPERDKTEGEMIDLALGRDIPVLGICRGAQFLNAHFGGGITRGIPDHVGKHHALVSQHEILNGKVVNSFHNDGIAECDMAKDLEPLAFSSDRYVEAFRHRTRRAVGILWHPERQSEKMDVGLLDNIMYTLLGMSPADRKK